MSPENMIALGIQLQLAADHGASLTPATIRDLGRLISNAGCELHRLERALDEIVADAQANHLTATRAARHAAIIQNLVRQVSPPRPGNSSCPPIPS